MARWTTHGGDRSHPDFPHGTMNGYQNYKCRCDECREAWRIYYASKPWGENYRRRVLGQRPLEEYRAEIDPGHGSWGYYTGRGCRCDKCRAFGNEQKRQWRARNQEHQRAYDRERKRRRRSAA